MTTLRTGYQCIRNGGEGEGAEKSSQDKVRKQRCGVPEPRKRRVCGGNIGVSKSPGEGGLRGRRLRSQRSLVAAAVQR